MIDEQRASWQKDRGGYKLPSAHRSLVRSGGGHMRGGLLCSNAAGQCCECKRHVGWQLVAVPVSAWVAMHLPMMCAGRVQGSLGTNFTSAASISRRKSSWEAAARS
ncbi:hypothetical protein Ancab_017045 [Ancistrocladus abbreviatus]